jgi:hypothetical protein
MNIVGLNPRSNTFNQCWFESAHPNNVFLTFYRKNLQDRKLYFFCWYNSLFRLTFLKANFTFYMEKCENFKFKPKTIGYQRHCIVSTN